MTELHEHLTAHHPGIRQATGPTGMYPQGRPVMHLEVAHDMQHQDSPEYQDHRHNPDGSLVMQTAKAWPERCDVHGGRSLAACDHGTTRTRPPAQACRYECDPADPAIRVCATHQPDLGLYGGETCAGPSCPSTAQAAS
jgi:hypothetical protein